MITFTESAREKVSEYMEMADNGPIGVRVIADRQGRHRFQYGMSLVLEGEASDGDVVQDEGPFKVFMDPDSAGSLEGAIVGLRQVQVQQSELGALHAAVGAADRPELRRSVEHRDLPPVEHDERRSPLPAAGGSQGHDDARVVAADEEAAEDPPQDRAQVAGRGVEALRIGQARRGAAGVNLHDSPYRPAAARLQGALAPVGDAPARPERFAAFSGNPVGSGCPERNEGSDGGLPPGMQTAKH